MRPMLEFRFVMSLALSAIVGALGLRTWPFPTDDPILGLIHEMRPAVYAGFSYAYAAAWFTTPLIAISACLSSVYIFASEWRRRETHQALPPYPAADRRDDLFLVLGEQHHAATPRRAAAPRWLTIPERGLYTGMAIVGAVGTGKTTACMYPYVEQLLAYRASDRARRS